MHYIIVPTKLCVFVLDGIEAVRTSRDNSAMFGCSFCMSIAGCVTVTGRMTIASGSSIEAVAIQHFDILLGHHLPEILVSNAPSGIASTGLFGTENSKVNFGCQENFRYGSGNLLVALIKRTHATNPVKDI